LRASAQTCLSASTRLVQPVEVALSEVGPRFLHDLADADFDGIGASILVGGGSLKSDGVKVVGQQREERGSRGGAQAANEECAASQHRLRCWRGVLSTKSQSPVIR
jgi:hypothetical protein